jgi:DNA polymerase-3 subunit gamma/tau
MSYQVLARKWRPANFSQLVGQEHVVQALANALDNQRLHHAYLFSGTRGVGKTTIARIFAKSLNCEQGISSEPCGQCSSCNEIDQGRSVDLIEIDAASRTGVDDMRELLDNVQYAPTRSRFKIYLIDEVHMLSRHSFNALLKTLEEPPPHIKFLLATTDPQKLPVTVLSRCLQFNLKRMSKAQILAQLQFLTGQEQVNADDNALVQLAGAADGSMRDALSLLDQAIGHGGGAVSQQGVESMLGSISRDYLARLLQALADQQATELLREARQIIEHNPDYQRVCAELIAFLQQVALYQADPRLVIDDEFDEGLLQQYASCWSAEEIQLFYQILLQGRQDLLICPDEAAGFEMLMLRMIAFSPEPEQDSAAHRLKKKPDLSAPSAPRSAREQPESPSATVTPATVPRDEPEAAPVRKQDSAPASTPAPSPVSATKLAATGAESPAAAAETAQPPPVASGDEVVAERAGEAAVSRIGKRAPAPAERLGGDAAAEGARAIDWLKLAYELELTGMAQELVANSEFLSASDSAIELRLARELYDLVDEVSRSEITEALQRKLGVSLRLQLTAADELTGVTPLQAKLERQRDERLAAIDAIREEALVKKLQNAFAAELDEASVVKIETNP